MLFTRRLRGLGHRRDGSWRETVLTRREPLRRLAQPRQRPVNGMPLSSYFKRNQGLVMLLICLSTSFAVAGSSTVAAVIRPGWLPRLGRQGWRGGPWNDIADRGWGGFQARGWLLRTLTLVHACECRATIAPGCGRDQLVRDRTQLGHDVFLPFPASDVGVYPRVFAIRVAIYPVVVSATCFTSLWRRSRWQNWLALLWNQWDVWPRCRISDTIGWHRFVLSDTIR